MYNKVIIIGRLTATPELHKTSNEKICHTRNDCGQSPLQGSKW